MHTISQPLKYSKTTHLIRVTIQPYFLNEQSKPENFRYLWAYHVQIENLGDVPMQVKNRYWQITDAHGTTHDIYGEGIVSEQPLLNPGELYEYTSGTPLQTSSGFMFGYYEVESPDGEILQIPIPTFSLDSPFSNQSIN